MKKVKQIFTLLLASFMLIVSTGFALHSVECLITGETFHSVHNADCCCGTHEKHEQNCCDDETLVIKVDTEAVQKEFKTSVEPVFFTAFIIHFVNFAFSTADIDYSTSVRHTPPLPDRDIIILVQSFLI